MREMVDFDLFVKTLGPHAKQYTPQQLKQLHVEVRKLAEVLLAVHEAKVAARKNQSSPQGVLDEVRTDRTMTKRVTERAADEKSSAVHIS